MSSSSSSLNRVPFRFPFNPPDIALPLSQADFLTHHLSAQQKDTYIAGTVKWIAAGLALGGVYTLLQATRQWSNHRDATANSSSSSSSSNRRRTLQPELNLEGIARGRKSRVSHANKQHDASSTSAASSAQPSAPFSLGIVTPRSLERYGQLLLNGFEELAVKEKNIAANARVLSSVQLLVPAADERLNDFVARVNHSKFDVILLQYHGASTEDVVAFQDYMSSSSSGVSIPTPRILILHRPEEILERHAHHLFKEAQYNIERLIKEVDVVVVLGEASRPSLLKKFSAVTNVCVVPHGFSSISEQDPTPRKLTPYTIVGACAHFNDMRWVTDLVQLHKTIQEYAYPSETSNNSNDPTSPKHQTHHKPATNISNALKQVVVYACGEFHTFVDPITKQTVDQIAALKNSSYAEHVKFVDYDVFTQAESAGKFNRNDVNSFKAFLYKLSEQGRKLLLCTNGGSQVFDHSLHHNQAYDFSIQLFREHLKNFAPKIEYSGALHQNPGASIPIVFESPAMGDVEIEGMNLITVPYQGSSISASSASSSSTSSSSSNAAVGNTCCPTGAYPDCCPWYTSATHCPDFAPTVETIAKYILSPTHYQSHRANTHDAAKQLSMRHVAAQYQHIISQLFLD